MSKTSLLEGMIAKAHDGSLAEIVRALRFCAADKNEYGVRYGLNALTCTKTDLYVTDGRMCWHQTGDFAKLNRSSAPRVLEFTGPKTNAGLCGESERPFPDCSKIIPNIPTKAIIYKLDPYTCIAQLAALWACSDGLESYSPVSVWAGSSGVGFVMKNADLGIEATANMKEDNQKLLGSCSPVYLGKQLAWHALNGAKSVDLFWAGPKRAIRTDSDGCTGVLMPVHTDDGESHPRLKIAE